MHQIVQFQSQKCKSSLVWEGDPPPTPSPRSGASRPRLRCLSNIVDSLAPQEKIPAYGLGYRQLPHRRGDCYHCSQPLHESTAMEFLSAPLTSRCMQSRAAT